MAAAGAESTARPVQLATDRGRAGTPAADARGRTDMPPIAARHVQGRIKIDPTLARTGTPARINPGGSLMHAATSFRSVAGY